MKKKGPKRHLSLKSLKKLKDKYGTETVGGATLSKTDLKKELEVLIKEDRERETSHTYPHKTIPTTTMKRYINTVTAEEELNIFKSVGNKSESRCTAEYSIRSTIAYLMVVLTTHFFRAVPHEYSMSTKDLEKNPVFNLVKKLNDKALGMDQLSEKENTSLPLTHALSQMITTTDECSMFITSEEVKKKEVFYISIRPHRNMIPTVDSSRRNNFTTNRVGDLHMRDIRVVLNNTFTAGGRSAPIFACIYGLSNIEMPGDEIVIRSIKGFVPASDINGSMEEGLVLFIRGKYNNPMDEDDTNNIDPNESNLNLPCKEARVAKIYREKIYYPLIKDIRVNHYNMDPNTEVIPDNLRAISWMDGCHGQLKLITIEGVLDKEKNLNIVSDKHSPARTGVEQAADLGPMFRNLRKNVKSMPAEQNVLSPITSRLTTMLDDLLPGKYSCTHTDIVIIKGTKRKAIVEGLSKLPNAMGDAYNRSAIVSGFHDNGQIDKLNKTLPCLKSLIGTYRGPISKDHCLNECTSLVTKFYNEMYLTGRIEESSFENEEIMHDTDSFGNKVTRDYSVSRENYQRAKVLSASTQREARIKLRASIEKKVADTKEKSILTENKKYQENEECEKRVSILFHKLQVKIETNNACSTDNKVQQSFQSIQLSRLTSMHFGMNLEKGFIKYKSTMPQMKAFIQVRDPNLLKNRTKNYPVYKPLTKRTREQLIDECMTVVLLPKHPKQFS